MLGITNRALDVIKNVFVKDGKVTLQEGEEICFRYGRSDNETANALGLVTDSRQNLSGFEYVEIDGLRIFFYLSEAESFACASCIIDFQGRVFDVIETKVFKTSTAT